MSFNLIDLVKSQLGGPAIGQLGALLGEDNNKTEAALGAAIPGLLSGLTASAKVDNGASLFNAVSNQDEGLLDNIGGLLTGNNSSTVMDQGSNMLGSLLGNGVAGGLASAVSSLSGIGGKSSSGLMGMLMPIVLGMVKRKIFGSGGGFSQNAGGLLNLLDGQKDNIQAAMPAGFQDQLQSTGFMDQLSSSSTGAANAVGEAASSVGSAASGVANAAGNTASNAANAAGTAVSGSGGMLRKLLPVAAIVAVAVIGWNFLSGKEVPEVAVPDISANVPAIEMPDIEVGDISIGNEIGDIFSGATTAVGSITDVDSATAAVPALTDITGKVDGLSGIWDKIPEAARGPLTSMLGDNMGKLTPMLDKVNEIPGVSGVLEPVIGPLLEKLQGLAQ